MIDFRVFCVGVLLVFGPVPALAQSGSPLANIDRELTTLCARLPMASGADTAAVRSRLAALWRQRLALLATLPGERRSAVQQSSSVSAQCLTLAKTAAEPRAVAPKIAPKATGPMPEKRAFRNGGGAAVNPRRPSFHQAAMHRRRPRAGRHRLAPWGTGGERHAARATRRDDSGRTDCAPQHAAGTRPRLRCTAIGRILSLAAAGPLRSPFAGARATWRRCAGRQLGTGGRPHHDADAARTLPVLGLLCRPRRFRCDPAHRAARRSERCGARRRRTMGVGGEVGQHKRLVWNLHGAAAAKASIG